LLEKLSQSGNRGQVAKIGEFPILQKLNKKVKL